MVRYTIEGSPIKIAYGYDIATGVFLSVYDNRLKYNSEASDEVNNVFEKSAVMGLASGDGAYLDMHTAEHGFGYQVSWAVMSVYLGRYGVPKDHIRDLLKQNLKRLSNMK